MDPNATLETARSIVRFTRSPSRDMQTPTELLEDLVAAVENLDEWLGRGGFLPTAWAEARFEGRDPREVVADVEQAIKDGRVVSCSECSEELPSDTRCEVAEDGEHVPDQDVTDPPEDQPTRVLELALRVQVPNDGYEYGTDVAGRLETLLPLLLLHPLVSGAGTAGRTGSGYVRDAEWGAPSTHP